MISFGHFANVDSFQGGVFPIPRVLVGTVSNSYKTNCVNVG